ncbi:hypothetical protein AYL99_09841 [Fonsecaea erecta]|uniref:Uncharacterized protein n=1 Tax=Fonsecaea erecta TaxID=1367422 RepID=A0A178Z7D4_9EURO|nr:hypothetical protein AYL99_09841 [Fonsecaea erecta]OAP55689.1 hypothetical protein AYL99_09841 [Fonsecaea erecta]
MANPPVFVPTTPSGNDSYICYLTSDTCLILNSGVDPIKLSNLKLTVDNCFIYSETIEVDTDVLAFPGNHLGLFCTSLIGPNTFTIDVSGSDGARVDLALSGTGSLGNPGRPGGKVWIYVEQMTDDLIYGLKIRAHGGHGGAGGDTTDLAAGGGQGGNGGAGGSAEIYYGSVSGTLLAAIRAAQAISWPSQLTACLKVLGSCVPPAVSERWVSSQMLSDAKTTLGMYQEISDALTAVTAALGPVANPTGDLSMPQPLPATSDTAGKCLQMISKLVQNLSAPPLQAKDSMGSLATEVVNSINAWSQDGSEDSESLMVTAIRNLSQNLSNTGSGADLSNLWNDLFAAIEDMELSWRSMASVSMVTAFGGRPGIGGRGPLASSPIGAQGAPGPKGTTSAILLGFDGRPEDLAVSQVCAFPDQCQMLLDAADRLFFTNNPVDIGSAAVYYLRLSQRLAFVPNLSVAVESSTETASKLQLAYASAEASGLTLSAIPRLQQVYARAKSGLNKISLQQDLFGHSPNWDPRLSVDFYTDGLDQLLANLKDIEASVQGYYKAIVLGNEADSKQNFQTASAAFNNNTDQIAFLTGDNGILKTSATKITALTPKLTRARDDIKAKVQAVESDIRKNINLNPTDLLDALATVAMAPSEGFAAAEGASVAYKAWTTVDDAQGDSVNKDFIISQLGSCEGTLESLSEAYSVRDDGHVSVDDPGAMKIIAAANSLENIVARYKSAITGADADALKASLDTYISVIQQRNDAVLTYNAGLQMLHEAHVNAAYNQKQMETLGTAIATADPKLPAVYQWLDQTQNQTRLDIMQQLNYAARALRFWGLYPTFTFAEPGPLLGYQDLQNNYDTLKSTFKEYIAKYSLTPPHVWPGDGEPGIVIELDRSQIPSFLTPTSDGGKFELFWIINASDPYFPGMYNIRLSQVRVWIIGPSLTPDPLGRQLLTVEIQHIGNEQIVSPEREIYTFVHDAVSFQFKYDVSRVKTKADCTDQVIFDKEVIEAGDFTSKTPDTDLTTALAPLGPFTMWRIIVDPAENPGLVMNTGNVSTVMMEFQGSNMAPSSSFDAEES